MLTILLLSLVASNAQFAKGKGAEENPYQIATLDDSFDERFFRGGLHFGISASEVHNDSVYVGGSFVWIDGQTHLKRIGRWTGTTLEPVGEGFNGTVETLKSIDGMLYAGGNFTRSGETTVNRIARFNENTRKWEPVGEGFNNSVHTLASHHGDIIAGGSFSMSGDEPVDYVARWDGENWQPMGDGFNFRVLALKEYGDTLVAGGEFRLSGDRSIYRMARWDGENWQPMDQGLGEPGTIGLVVLHVRVQSLTVYNGELVAGGNFWLGDENGNIFFDTQGVARWDGEHWRPLGSGLSHSSKLDGFLVKSLLDLEGDLYAAGSFNESGDTPINHIARWQDSTWVNVGDGFDAPVTTLSKIESRLVAGGNFNKSGENNVHRLAMLENDNTWSAMIEPGPDGQAPAGPIFSLLHHDGFLYTGGIFQKVGDLSTTGIARWDGNKWEPLGKGLSGGVHVLHYHNGDLYAGGTFTRSGEQTVRGLARWDGEMWHDTGANLFGFPDAMGEDMAPGVRDITSFGDYLAIAGIFRGGSHQDGNWFYHIGLWDGEKWNRSAEGQPFWAPSSVVEYQGYLIVGDASRHEEESVFRLNMEEEEWETMGEQFAFVDVLTVFNGHLYAAGGYREKNGEVSNRIARWDEDHWKPIHGVFNSDIFELYEHEGQLYVAGHFTEIDGEPAQRIARWNGSR